MAACAEPVCFNFYLVNYHKSSPIVQARDNVTIYLKLLILFWFKRVQDRGPEQRESKLTVLCPLIIIILISYITIYRIIIKLLIMENHPRQNQKQNFFDFCC